MALHFIPPPGFVMQNQQHVTVHQVHNPGFEIIHPAPIAPIVPFYRPMVPFHHISPLMPVAYYPPPARMHHGAVAMNNFAPGVLPHNVARQRQILAHIVTYSTARLAAGDPTAHALYEQALISTGLQPLITFDVSHFPAPPSELAANFTGVSEPIQECVRGYDEGMRDLDEVVRLVMSEYDQGAGSLLLQVACPGGTHRSVAVGEIIKKKLLRRGVTTVHINHAHRVRHPGDSV